MNNKYIVKQPIILIDFLMENMDKTHKKAKQLLTNEAVLVNNKVVTKYNHPLLNGDTVSIKGYNSNNINPRIEILYEDNNIIVLNKPSGLLTISTDSEKEKTLFHIVSDYVKIKNKNARIFIIHRLDKDTSGIIMFAKNEKVKKLYQDSWEEICKYRGYAALVEGKVTDSRGRSVLYLAESPDGFKVYSTNSNNGKKAITLYHVISKNDKYSLLDVEIQTGRRNQIRVAMQNINHPVVGDYKYGSKDKSLKRLGLHAYKLIIVNPLTKKEMIFEVSIPKEFYKLAK